MSWDCPGILKSRIGKDVVSNSWKSIKSLFRAYIHLGSRDTRVQSFDHVTSSNLKWWECSKIWVFLAALIDTVPWTLADT